jgi:integrase
LKKIQRNFGQLLALLRNSDKLFDKKLVQQPVQRNNGDFNSSLENDADAGKGDHRAKWTVTKTAKGQKKMGKLSGTNRVNVQIDTWTAQFVDEAGKVQRMPTQTTNRDVVEKILAQYEKEIDRIKSGVITREELDRVQVRYTPLGDLLEQFRIKMIADGTTAGHIDHTLRKITTLFAVCEIDTVAKIRREAVERWIAQELKGKIRAVGTINSYVIALKSFVQYLIDTGILTSHPLKSIRKLNTDLDQRKKRRAMTKEEVNRFLLPCS